MMAYALLKIFGDEKGIRAAYDANPSVIKRCIEEEIAAHAPLLLRNYVSREYMMMLRRVLGIHGENLHQQHEKQMRDALARAGITKETVLANIQTELAKKP